ncbi:4-alpha-glucanotransferase, partial [Chloroflexota bacterium]
MAYRLPTTMCTTCGTKLLPKRCWRYYAALVVLFPPYMMSSLWQRVLGPATVAWEGKAAVLLRLPAKVSEANLHCLLELEDGCQRSWQCPVDELPIKDIASVEGNQYVVRKLALSDRLPPGYHRLKLELYGGQEESLIISAPESAFPNKLRAWGAFLPLYALYTGQSWGGGDYRDMEALANWLSDMGAQVIAALPLLATFPNDASPYLPVSRLMWNELYITVDRVPELAVCPKAQVLLQSSLVLDEIETLRRLPLVDYRRQTGLKRKVLEELCRHLFREPSHRLESLKRFARSHLEVEDYARFRAAGEEQGSGWQDWPHPLREGKLSAGDFNQETQLYYLYVQWLAHQQMEQLSKKVIGAGLRLYLDLPLGVHPDGYDSWRQRSKFIAGASAGAPPDVVFTRGQDWTFSPMHPDNIRAHGYQHITGYLRHHLRYANILRLDHVMGLHRL